MQTNANAACWTGRNALGRLGVTAVFFFLGATAGTWAARIPAVKGQLHLSAGTLGLCLLGPALGAAIAMPAAGALLATMPPRRVVQFAVVTVGLLPATTLVTSPWELFLVLVGWGVGLGTVDVGMNTQAAALQAHLGRRIMARFHAAFSGGLLVGSGLGALAAAERLSARVDFALAAVVVYVATLASAQTFERYHARRENSQAASARERRWPTWSAKLAAIAVISFAAFLAEGAVSDWSAVYLHSSLGASLGVAALGFTGFSCVMTCSRLAGDRLADFAGPVRLIRVSASVAALALAGALIISRVWAGIAGFGLLALGLASVVPLAFSSAAQLGRQGPNLAFVTTCGYVGMLAGPAMIGGIAEEVGLPGALGVVVALTVLIAVLAGALRPNSALRDALPPPPADIVIR
ncbi:MAG: MFS transporter [Acidimicrobiales bacterium]